MRSLSSQTICMLKIKRGIFISSLLCFQLYFSQSVTVKGKVDSQVDVENIHVINKTAQVFTITNRNGEFEITVSLNDVIVFSSIQQKSKSIIVDKNMILFKALRVTLEEQINELDEVIVGKILTGNLLLDVQNVEGDAPINFFDVGIPGYTGKIATQSERRLYEATTGGGIIPLNPILNAISGRTKQLKTQVKLEENEALMLSIKGRLANDFFASNPLAEDLKMDFFFFCADDENFMKHCKNQTDFSVLIFLRMKYRQYLENLETTKD